MAINECASSRQKGVQIYQAQKPNKVRSHSCHNVNRGERPLYSVQVDVGGIRSISMAATNPFPPGMKTLHDLLPPILNGLIDFLHRPMDSWDVHDRALSSAFFGVH